MKKKKLLTKEQAHDKWGACEDCGEPLYERYCHCVDAGTPAELIQAHRNGRLTKVGYQNARTHGVQLPNLKESK